MKTLALFLSCFLCAGAFAETISITDKDADEVRAAIPLELVTALHNSGLPFKAGDDGTFTIHVRNLRCDWRHNGALDSASPEAGVPAFACRRDTKNVRDSRRGKALGNPGALLDILGSKLELSDCAMGYCGTWIESISCTVDTKVESFSGQGRFTCTVETGI